MNPPVDHLSIVDTYLCPLYEEHFPFSVMIKMIDHNQLPMLI